MYCGVKTNLVNFQLEVARLFENLLTLSKLWAFRNGKSIKTRHPDSLLESNVCFETVELKTIISNSSTMNQHIFSILAQKKWKIESNINVRGNCAASYNCHCPPINCHGQRKDPEQQASFFVRWGKYFVFYLPATYLFSAIFNNISERSFICLPHSWFTSLQKKQYEHAFSWHPCFFSTQLFWPWKSWVPCNSSKCLNSWNIPTFVNGKRLSPNFLLETCSMPDCKAKVLNQKIFLFKIS